MADTLMIWRVAGVIDSLTSQLDMLSRYKDLSLRLMALSLQAAVNTANSRYPQDHREPIIRRYARPQIDSVAPAIKAFLRR